MEPPGFDTSALRRSVVTRTAYPRRL